MKLIDQNPKISKWVCRLATGENSVRYQTVHTGIIESELGAIHKQGVELRRLPPSEGGVPTLRRGWFS